MYLLDPSCTHTFHTIMCIFLTDYQLILLVPPATSNDQHKSVICVIHQLRAAFSQTLHNVPDQALSVSLISCTHTVAISSEGEFCLNINTRGGTGTTVHGEMNWILILGLKQVRQLSALRPRLDKTFIISPPHFWKWTRATLSVLA